jgi:peroxiredoxin
MKATKLKIIIGLVVLMFWNTNSTAQNSKMQAEIKLINELHKPTYAKRDSLSYFYKIFYEKIGSTRDTVIQNQLRAKILEFDKITDENNKKELLNEFGFVRQYPSCIISLDILHAKIIRREATEYLETFTNLYSILSSELKNSPKGNNLKELLENFTNTSEGKIAPDFTVKDFKNNTLNLSSFQGKKYVLLNFWASWNEPCISDILFLKEVNEKYSSLGLEIINISNDDDMGVLRKAIEKDKLNTMKHAASIMNNSYLEGMYFVTSIPQKILIDKEGVIVSRWRGAGEENQLTLTNELNRIFNQKIKIKIANKNTLVNK